MLNSTRTTTLALAATIAMTGVLTAQVPLVRISQRAETRQTVGLADVSVTYHRPGVKDRTIWGGLLKYGEVWRAGANEPTLITFSKDVDVAGTALKAGTYRFLVVPMENGPWAVIFNSEVKNWGTVYDSTHDVARISVTPESGAHEEWMSFSFDALSGSGATLVLRWEKIALNLPLTFDTEGLYAAAIRSSEGDVWRAKNSFARYLMDYGNDQAQALKVAEEAIRLDENSGTVRTKAEIQAKMGKYKDAVSTMERAISIGKAQNPRMNTSFLQSMIDDWKKMK